MMLMHSVVYHDLFDHLFDGPAAALRWDRIGSESDRIGSDGRLRCVTGIYGTAVDGGRAVPSCSLLSDRSSRSSIRMYVTFRACPYHHKARPACMSSTGWPPAAPDSIVHTCRHSLTHWPSPIRLEHSDVDGARAPSPATRTSSTLPWSSPLLTPSCLTSSFIA